MEVSLANYDSDGSTRSEKSNFCKAWYSYLDKIQDKKDGNSQKHANVHIF